MKNRTEKLEHNFDLDGKTLVEAIKILQEKLEQYKEYDDVKFHYSYYGYDGRPSITN